MFQKKLFLLNLVIAFLCFANGAFAQKRIKGEGTVVKQNREVGAFTKISLESSADVEIMQGASSSVVVETYPNISEMLDIFVENSTLKIRMKKAYWEGWSVNADKLKIWITNPTYEKISVSGSGNIVANGKLNASTIEVTVTGSGDLKIADLSATNTKLQITGSGNITAQGKSDATVITVTGSGDANFMNFVSRSVEARIAGSGNLSCNATENYDLNVSGSGDINYKKTNATVNSHSSGSGSISSKN